MAEESAERFWTDERNALLIRLHGERHSASEIAATLGGGISRNAVLGKVDRLRKAGRIPPPGARRAAIAASLAAAPVAAEATASQDTREGPSGTAPAAPPAAVRAAAPRGVRLADLGNLEAGDRQCRFILGEVSAAATRYCGARTVAEGKPYCPEHHARCCDGAGPRMRLGAFAAPRPQAA